MNKSPHQSCNFDESKIDPNYKFQVANKMTLNTNEVKQSGLRVERFRPFQKAPNTECEFTWDPAAEDDAMTCDNIKIVELYMNGVPFLDQVRYTSHFNESDLKLLCLGYLLDLNI